MALDKRELEELKGLHGVINHVDCYNVRDLRFEGQLILKASAAQLQEVCACCYKGED